jgi:hypothetical protein
MAYQDRTLETVGLVQTFRRLQIAKLSDIVRRTSAAVERPERFKR